MADMNVSLSGSLSSSASSTPIVSRSSSPERFEGFGFDGKPCVYCEERMRAPESKLCPECIVNRDAEMKAFEKKSAPAPQKMRDEKQMSVAEMKRARRKEAANLSTVMASMPKGDMFFPNAKRVKVEAPAPQKMCGGKPMSVAEMERARRKEAVSRSTVIASMPKDDMFFPSVMPVAPNPFVSGLATQRLRDQELIERNQSAQQKLDKMIEEAKRLEQTEVRKDAPKAKGPAAKRPTAKKRNSFSDTSSSDDE